MLGNDNDDDATKRRNNHHEADVVVVGAGILGCAIAVALGKQGRSVLLLEKSLKEPDRIVGELLQPGGVSALETLGLRDCLDGIDSIRVQGYEVIYYGDAVHIPYPAEVGGINSGRRPEGRSFHHGRFIQRLREAARNTPNVSLVETKVTELVSSDMTGQILGVESETEGRRDYYFGHLTIVADGYASKFRKRFIRHQPVSRSKFYGLELVDADLPRPNHGHVVLGEGAPVLLYQIGTHETRALVDVPENLPSASVARGGVKGHLRHTVLPALPKSVQPSFEAALDRGHLRSMPNSWLPPSINKTPGLILLGDAMNMRHPLTGGGMTVAFNDVVLLSELLHPDIVPGLHDTKKVLRQMATFHWRRKRLTSVINILAQALYALFAANDPQLRALQLGCFRYFQMGGRCIDGPVGLLAGIIRQPLILFYHFFAVALLSIWILLSSAFSTSDTSSSTSSPPKSVPTSASTSSHTPKNNSPISSPSQEKEETEKEGPLSTESHPFLDGSSSTTEQSVKQSPTSFPQKQGGSSILNIFRLPMALVASMAVFWKACMVLFPFIFSELKP